VTAHVGQLPPAPQCPACDAKDSLEVVSVDARVVFRYVCSCCAKEHDFAAHTLLIDYDPKPLPKVDVNGNVIDGP
jgi:hypothetical protein